MNLLGAGQWIGDHYLYCSEAFPTDVQDEFHELRETLDGSLNESYDYGRYNLLYKEDLIYIPSRIFFSREKRHEIMKLSQSNIFIKCLLTRSTNGHIREIFLNEIIGIEKDYIDYFIFLLIGEYVLEILDCLMRRIDEINIEKIRQIAKNNINLYKILESRVCSYWDLNYKNVIEKKDYSGFKLIEAIALN